MARSIHLVIWDIRLYFFLKLKIKKKKTFKTKQHQEANLEWYSNELMKSRLKAKILKPDSLPNPLSFIILN